MSFMITSEYNNYLVIFVECNISFHRYCDVKYYEFNILGLKTTTLGYMLSSIYINMACCLICLTYIVEMYYCKVWNHNKVICCSMSLCCCVLSMYVTFSTVNLRYTIEEKIVIDTSVFALGI